MKHLRRCNIVLLLLVGFTLASATTDNVYSVVRANTIKTRSISSGSDERTNARPSLSLLDDDILSTFIRALDVINTPDCVRDFNATIVGIQQRLPWAVASKSSFLFIDFFPFFPIDLNIDTHISHVNLVMTNFADPSTGWLISIIFNIQICILFDNRGQALHMNWAILSSCRSTRRPHALRVCVLLVNKKFSRCSQTTYRTD